jgi:hypothetical protein
MRYGIILVVALALSACAEPPQRVASAVPSTIPPTRVEDCVALALLDDHCTANWYGCRSPSDEDRTCVKAWKECCTLRGQGSRSRLGAAEGLTRD